MESRMVKFYSKESNMVAIHAIPGHFATSHSHINYYIDITSLKTMLMYGKEASNRKQEIDRQHHTIPNKRTKDKHYGNVHNRLWNHG